jgi:hypothetical protein
MVDKAGGFASGDERRCRMRNRALVVVAALVGSVGALLPRAYAADADGKKIFLDSKCNLCHAVSSAGIDATTTSDKIKGPNLTGIVAGKGADWTTKWLHKAVDLDGKKHPVEFKGSDADMATLVSWLQAQK